MTYFAIDNKGIGQYVEADSWIDAESFCACNNLTLIGEVIVILEAPGLN